MTGLEIMAGISAGMAVVGTGLTAVSSISQSNNMRAQADASKSLSESQAAMYMYNAQEGKAAADRAGFEQGVKTRKLLATQRADYGKAGVVFGEGSPLEVAADSASMAEFDALALKHQGDLALWRGEVGAANARAGGAASSDLLNSGADTTLLTGFGKAGAQLGQAGVEAGRFFTKDTTKATPDSGYTAGSGNMIRVPSRLDYF